MKTLFIYAAILSGIFTSVPAFAQKSTVKETIQVSGNCTMCKKNIERAAIAAGASSANWNSKTGLLKIAYTPAQTSGEKVQQAIARSGYDTRDFTADNAAYEALDACCQYQRKSDPILPSKKDSTVRPLQRK